MHIESRSRDIMERSRARRTSSVFELARQDRFGGSVVSDFSENKAGGKSHLDTRAESVAWNCPSGILFDRKCRQVIRACSNDFVQQATLNTQCAGDLSDSQQIYACQLYFCLLLLIC